MFNTALRTEKRIDIPFSPELEGPPALEVRAVYNGIIIGTRFLSDVEPKRRLRAASGPAPESNYTIGQSPEADAPAPSDILGATDMPLVSHWSAGFLINVTPRMTGDVAVGGKVYRLADYLAGRGANFTLPDDGRARIDCGAMSFQLQHTTSARPLPRRWLAWRWNEQKFTLGSFLALGSLLLLCFAIPPNGTSVSSDLIGMSRAFIATTFKPAEVEPTPDFLKKGPGNESGAASQALAGESGKAGDAKSKKPTGRLAIEGNSPDTRVGKAEAEARIRDRGILGVLNSATNPVFASIFSRESAVGSAKESVMGNLIAANIDNGWGAGGWGVVGTGLGGGGTGEDTIGIGRYGTLGGRGYGPGSGDGPGSGYGPGGGGLRPHHTISPSVIPGTVTTRGTLDKEIVRRVVHLHMNEVKYCYDKELVRKTGLEGRVSVQFIIAANGQVINSFMNSTTMNNVNVEKCVIDAVKRWQFPSPAGGGIVIVSYPFNFTAGSGN